MKKMSNVLSETRPLCPSSKTGFLFVKQKSKEDRKAPFLIQDSKWAIVPNES